MAEHRDLTKILDNVEEDLKHAHPPATRAPANTVEAFAPQKYRNASDSMEQIQQDFRKALADMESRSRALIEELKRMAN